jgi:molybdopterin molybdotransferase
MTSTPPNRQPRTIEATLALIREHGQPLKPESVSLSHAAGRFLREAVLADADQPPFDRSAVDGYAIRLEDDTTDFLCVDRLRAGEWRPRGLRRGETVRVATGAALPDTGLQVVMQEEVQVREDRVTINQRRPDRNIRFRGEDARSGQVLLVPGVWLGPGALALLASVGCTQPQVSRLPRVLHLVSGNEIVPCNQTPVGSQIRDSNSVLVRAFLNAWTLEPVQFHAPENPDAMTAVLDRAKIDPGSVDLLLVSGGASVGDHDFTRSWLTGLGYTLHVERTAARPGKPMIFGSRGPQLAFGLPGNPLAHFACLNVYVRQALRQLLGAAETPMFSTAPLANDPHAAPYLPAQPLDQSNLPDTRRPLLPEEPLANTAGRDVPAAAILHKQALPQQHLPDSTDAAGMPPLPHQTVPRETLWPARLEGGTDCVRLTLLPWRSSGDLTALAAANALARIPQDRPPKRGDPALFLSTNIIP